MSSVERWARRCHVEGHRQVHILLANHVLPPRDEALVRTERFLTDTLADINHDPDRHLVAAFATWRVLRRLRRHVEQRPRTYTRHAHQQITAAPRLLAWLAQRHTTLRNATHPGRPRRLADRQPTDLPGP